MSSAISPRVSPNLSPFGAKVGQVASNRSESSLDAAMVGGTRVKNLQNEHLNRLAQQLAPAVREKTGFDVDLSRVHLAVLNPDEMVQAIKNDIKARTGEEPVGSTFMLKRAAAGVYLFSSQTIVIPRKRAQDATWDSLKAILFHELIHAGQHQKYPNFFADLDVVAKQSVGLSETVGKKAPATRAATSRLTARMTLVEGQAMYWQRKEKPLFPEQRSFRTGRDMLLSLAMLGGKGSRNKALQYARGASVFADIEKGKISKSFPDRAFKDPTLAERYLDTLRHTVALRHSAAGEPTLEETMESLNNRFRRI